MPNPRVYRAEIFEDSDWFALWRVVGANGDLIDQADVTNVDVNVYDLLSDTPGTAIYSSLAQAPSGCVFNSLQVDGFWHPDGVGYNVRYQVLNSNLPSGQRGGRRYHLELALNCAAGSFSPSGWGRILCKAEVSAKSRLAG